MLFKGVLSEAQNVNIRSSFLDFSFVCPILQSKSTVIQRQQLHKRRVGALYSVIHQDLLYFLCDDLSFVTA